MNLTLVIFDFLGDVVLYLRKTMILTKSSSDVPCIPFAVRLGWKTIEELIDHDMI